MTQKFCSFLTSLWTSKPHKHLAEVRKRKSLRLIWSRHFLALIKNVKKTHLLLSVCNDCVMAVDGILWLAFFFSYLRSVQKNAFVPSLHRASVRGTCVELWAMSAFIKRRLPNDICYMWKSSPGSCEASYKQSGAEGGETWVKKKGGEATVFIGAWKKRKRKKTGSP